MQALSRTSSLAAGATGRAGERRRPRAARAVPRPEQEQSVDVSTVKSVVAGAMAAPLLLLVSQAAAGLCRASSPASARPHVDPFCAQLQNSEVPATNAAQPVLPRPPLSRAHPPQAPHDAVAGPVPFGTAPTLPAPSEAKHIAETVRGIAISTPAEWSAAISAALGPAATRVSTAGSSLGEQSAELASALRQALQEQPAELEAAVTRALAQPDQLAAALAEAVEDPQMRSALVVGGFGGLALVVADAVRKVRV